MTLDALMKEHGLDYVDLLKIDIEGAEKEVFENAENWIGKVGIIAIELHDGIKPGCSNAFHHAVREFQRVGSRGETLFVARPSHLLSGKTDGVKPTCEWDSNAAQHGGELPCKMGKAS